MKASNSTRRSTHRYVLAIRKGSAGRLMTPVTLVRLLVLAVMLILASCGSAEDQTSGDSEIDPPPPSTTATTGSQATQTSGADVLERIEIAEQFMNAHQEHDAAAIQAITDPDASVLEFGFWRRTPADYEGLFQWTEILDWNWHLNRCEEEWAGPPSRVVCTYDTENRWSRAQGRVPVPGRVELLIDENRITQITMEINSDWGVVYGDWINWLDQNHPDEIRVLYRFDEEDQLTGGPATDPEAISLYEIRVAEYIEAVTGEREASDGDADDESEEGIVSDTD